MEFQIVASQGRARCGAMKLTRHTCETPMFMPVGTRGSVKGITSEQLRELDCQMILGNTYHLQSKPGSEIVQQLGGLHRFVQWPRGMLTDSGGFQMVSLLRLAEITEEGVEFRSPVDGCRMRLTPEESVRIQNRLGADVIMALDDVVPANTQDPVRFAEATHRTTRWLDRCLQAHERPHEQSLFPIVQGGMDLRLRDISVRDLIARQCPGYAIGGLAGGEDKSDFWRVVEFCTRRLPSNKPRYVMGIGYPLDIVVCSALGADMYDSVYPSRTARFGVALVSQGTLRLKNAQYANDRQPLDHSCHCYVCRHYSRAALHSLLLAGTTIGCRLVTYHNIAYMMEFTREMRSAIRAQRFPSFVKEFLRKRFPRRSDVPAWVIDALGAAEIEVGDDEREWRVPSRTAIS